MITRFYKILYKNKEVVYVGVTTRTINERFKEHIISKSLNIEDYSIVEFYMIEHPEITSLEIFYNEKLKVAELEQKFIKEELNKGSHLLNISNGGEWGTHILIKLKREEFLLRFGSYDTYKYYKKGIEVSKRWLKHWVQHRSENRAKVWLRNWSVNKSESRAKVWLRIWVHSRSINKTKVWLRNWVNDRKNNKTKVWLRHWIYNISLNRTKVWLRNWIRVKF